MPQTQNETITLTATPQQVWDTLTAVSQWPQWWSTCKSARFVEGFRLESTAQLAIHHRGLSTKTRVLLAIEPKKLVWEEKKFGLKIMRSWGIEQNENETHVTLRSDISGRLLLVYKLLGVTGRSQRIARANLDGLKQKLETN